MMNSSAFNDNGFSVALSKRPSESQSDSFLMYGMDTYHPNYSETRLSLGPYNMGSHSHNSYENQSFMVSFVE